MIQIQGTLQHKKTMLCCLQSFLDIRSNHWETYADDLIYAKKEDRKIMTLDEATRKKTAVSLFQQAFAIARPDYPQCPIPLSFENELKQKIEKWNPLETLSLSKEEFLCLQDVLEEYFRIRYAQIFYLADSLIGKEGSKNKTEWKKFLSQRDNCLELLQEGICAAQPYRNKVIIYKQPSCMEAEDIWSVFRYAFYWYRVQEKEIDTKTFSRDSYPPLLLTNTTPIQCHFVKEEK